MSRGCCECCDHPIFVVLLGCVDLQRCTELVQQTALHVLLGLCALCNCWRLCWGWPDVSAAWYTALLETVVVADPGLQGGLDTAWHNRCLDDRRRTAGHPQLDTTNDGEHSSHTHPRNAFCPGNSIPEQQNRDRGFVAWGTPNAPAWPVPSLFRNTVTGLEQPQDGDPRSGALGSGCSLCSCAWVAPALADRFWFCTLQSVQTFGRKVGARSQRPLFCHSARRHHRCSAALLPSLTAGFFVVA